MLCSELQNFVKNCVETASWIGRIMAEIERYCFEAMRDSLEFTRVRGEPKGKYIVVCM